jgi:nucleoside-diphosphate-sugar epimerase
LVTGATGFAGRIVVDRLRASGHQVLVTTRGHGLPAHWNDPGVGSAAAPVVEAVGVDLADLEGAPLSLDGIVHAGAATPGPNLTLDTVLEANVVGTRIIRDLAIRSGARAVVFLSSLSQYGRVSTDRLTVDTPSTDPDFYGLSKRLGEMTLATLAGGLDSGVAVTALRLPGVVGDAGAATRTGDDAVFLGRIRQRLLVGDPVTLTNGDRPFNVVLHVDDLAGVIEQALARTDAGVLTAVPAATDPKPLMVLVERMRDRLGSGSPITDQGRREPYFVIDTGARSTLRGDAMSVETVIDRFS